MLYKPAREGKGTREHRARRSRPGPGPSVGARSVARWRHSLLCIPASATGLLADSDSELPAKVCMQAPQHRQAGRLKRRKHAPQCPSLYIPSNLTGARLALAGWLADCLPAHPPNPPPACLSPENVRAAHCPKDVSLQHDVGDRGPTSRRAPTSSTNRPHQVLDSVSVSPLSMSILV